MGFLAPAFLAGLIAIAVPILVHLTHRERREVVVFPSLMFLQKIPYKSVRRQRLRHLLLLAMRCLALLLLVIAFARPLFGRRAGAVATDRGARELVILLDQSYSMEYGDRWERAVDAAQAAVGDLMPDDRATIIGFGERASMLVPSTADQALLRAALEGARPGAEGTRYAPAVRLARGILAESERPRRHAVLITDFQRAGWNRQEDVRFPPGTTVDHVDLSGGATPNVMVTGVELLPDASGDRERTALAARLANAGTDTVRGKDVILEIDGRRIDQQTVSIPPNGSAVATFAPVPVPYAGARATIRSAPDALPVDDNFHLVIERPRAIRVLIVSPQGGAGRGVYLRRALDIGTQPRFEVTTTSVDRIGAQDLDERDVVIMDDAGLPSSDAARRVAEFVRRGGGVIVTAGQRGASASWPAALEDLMPGAVGSVVDRTTTRGGAVGTIDRTHPALRLFSAPRSGDFSAARIFRYRSAEPRDGANVIARFDDGAPALLERPEGEGRVLLWTSTFDGLWNDLPIQPVFLPFVHELTKHAAQHREERPWAIAGRVADVSRQAAAVLGSQQSSGGNDGRELVAVAPSGARSTIPSVEGRFSFEATEQGFHEIRALDGRIRGARALAVNLDLAESDLATVDPEVLIAAMQAADTVGGTTADANATLAPDERERRQAAWWYLLVGALFLLAAETLVSNRLSRGAIPAPATGSNA